jgi:FAD/FMN-containing dehydrogenase
VPYRGKLYRMIATPAAALLSDLRTALDGAALLTSDGDQAGYLADQRHLYQGRALAIALPHDTQQVAKIMAVCWRHHVGVVPQGGNTSYCGGATPDATGSQLLLSLKRMNQIRAIDPAGFSLTAEAGCLLADVQQAAAAAQRYFPLSLGSAGSCMIGGNLATNAGGLNVLRFGMARDLVLGMEAVLPNGTVFDGLSSLRKDNTGYDLSSLLVGSEGTLAVITAASLKLWPAMQHTATAYVAIRDVAAALHLLTVLRNAVGDRLTSLEFLPAAVVQMTTRTLAGIRPPFERHSGASLLIELSSAAHEDLNALLQMTLAAAVARGDIQDAVVATNERERLEFWRLRESIPEMQRRIGASIKHDVSLPLAALPEFIDRVTAWVSGGVPDGQLVCYGHVGDGNLHCNVSQRPNSDVKVFLAREPAIKRAVHDLVQQFGGSISAEHGIGQLKVAELRRYASPVKLELLRRIKQAIDPSGIMNPGKLL